MLGAILGGIGSIVGSVLNKKSTDKQSDMQKDFAQNAIQWKVADATKAGLHPLAALGANTMSYSPIQTGDMAGPLSDMGQNVGRSIEATQNGAERSAGKLGLLQMERAGLENDLLRTQIASQNATLRAQLGPPMPTDGGAGQIIPGQGNSLVPSKLVPPQLTKGLNFGKGWDTNPYFSDAQTIEDRYGDSEVLSMLSAIANGGADYYWNNFGKSNAPFRKYAYPKSARKNPGFPRYGGNR